MDQLACSVFGRQTKGVRGPQETEFIIPGLFSRVWLGQLLLSESDAGQFALRRVNVDNAVFSNNKKSMRFAKRSMKFSGTRLLPSFVSFKNSIFTDTSEYFKHKKIIIISLHVTISFCMFIICLWWYRKANASSNATSKPLQSAWRCANWNEIRIENRDFSQELLVIMFYLFSSTEYNRLVPCELPSAYASIESWLFWPRQLL